MSSALSPKTWPFSLEWLPRSACLVGGTVRDALLGRQGEYLDLDFVLPEGAVETAEAIARHYHAGYVLLDADRQIARVVFESGTADFAQQVGSTLEADLERRDFTVNAIAYNPHADQLIDPLQGYADLQKRLLRMVSAENLAEDPLRLLRAFRQAAQLGFRVDAETRQVIRELAPHLSQIAAERIQSELNYLLSTPKGTPWLVAAWQDGLLKDWFPAASADSLMTIAAIDQTLSQLQETVPDFAQVLSSRIRSSPRTPRPAVASQSTHRVNPKDLLEPKAPGAVRIWLSTAKLTSLLPAVPAEAEAQLRRLKYSRNEIQAVSTILRLVPELQALVQPEPTPILPIAAISLKQQYEFFQAVGVTFPAVALLAIARGVPQTSIVPLIQRFLNPDDPVAYPTPLVTGQDLMSTLHLPAGPRIGQLLAAIQLARAEGKIATPDDALKLAAEMVQ